MKKELIVEFLDGKTTSLNLRFPLVESNKGTLVFSIESNDSLNLNDMNVIFSNPEVRGFEIVED
jgi:hypothetical protein